MQDVLDSEEVKEEKEEEKGEEVKKTSEYKRIDRPEDEDPDVQVENHSICSVRKYQKSSQYH